jgi:hypothetical protein
MKSPEEVTRETIEKGGVLAQLYFDVHGKDKEKIEHLLVDLANRIMAEQGVVYAVGEIERAIEMGDNNYSAAIRLKVLTKSLRDLLRICMIYAPMAIEVLEPPEIKLKIPEMHEVLMDASQMSYEFTTTMLYRVLSEEEKKDLQKKIEARSEMGKEILKKFIKKENEENEKKEGK